MARARVLPRRRQQARRRRAICGRHRDVSLSARYRLSVEPLGGDQEALVGLRTRSGEAWGILALYREPGRPRFDRDELEFLRGVSGHLAEGACRGLLIGEAADPDGPEAPGLVVLGEDWHVESMTPGVERWLGELSDGDRNVHGLLPAAVLSVAGQALGTAVDRDSSGEIAFRPRAVPLGTLDRAPRSVADVREATPRRRYRRTGAVVRSPGGPFAAARSARAATTATPRSHKARAPASTVQGSV